MNCLRFEAEFVTNMGKRMNRTSIVVVFSVILATTAGAAEWEDLATNSINRLPARTYSMPLACEADALTDELEPSTPYKLSLNGTWKISWAGNPALRVKDFWKSDFDDSRWFDIEVPSCVELKGFGSPAYSAGAYPHARKWPKILDFDTEEPDYNPVSSFRRKFTVPADWQGRQVILRFDGVCSAYYVWVNGKFVGYAEDSKLPSEFDVTRYLKDFRRETEDGKRVGDEKAGCENVLAVEVYRWCDGSYLEDQDMFRYSGIVRDVTLWSKQKDGIWDFTVKASVDGRLEVEVVDEVEKRGGGGQRMSLSLYDADKKKVGDLIPSSTSTYSLRLDAPHLWSAEDPYLYTLVIKKGDDIRMKRVGFKEQKIVGNVFTVNGKAVKLHGVNRHECSVEGGRTITLDDMVKDVTLFKRYNIDTVRTSHYPNHHLWYDLCDRYGIYVIAEANVEGHGYGFKEEGLGKEPQFDHSIVERNERQVVFYRNHPSVTLWSAGNETGHGDCFRHAIAAMKKLDPTRPVHWQIGNEAADVDSSMYPSVEWVEKRGQFGQAGGGALAAEKGEAFVTMSKDYSAAKPYVICEYAHAMGNAVGNLKEYWDAIYAYPCLMGGCIWDWVDQAIWKYTDKVDPKTGKRERYLAYGSDFDEVPGDGPFCLNGVVGPFREVSAKLIEVGHVYQPLSVEPAKDGGWTLFNRFGFTSSDALEARWTLLRDGEPVESGTFAPPIAPPLSSVPFKLPAKIADQAAVYASGKEGEYHLNVEFVTRTAMRWAPKGWVVARDQLALGGKNMLCRDSHVAVSMPTVKETRETVSVTTPRVAAVFSRASGTLSELKVDGVVVLKDPAEGIPAGPLLTCERAYTDNDRWMRHGDSWTENRKKGCVYSRGLTQLRYHARPIVIEREKGPGWIIVKTSTAVTGSKSAGFDVDVTWVFHGDGRVEVANHVVPHGTMPPALPRLGFSFKLDKAMERMKWYGRGPRENYVDRKTASFMGVWSSTVTDQYEPYVRPQDNGYKCDVRWVEFADAAGKGVRFSSDVPMFVQALHYGKEDMEFSRHRGDERRYRAPLVPREEVLLNLDLRQTGLGGGSCGPLPLDKYRFKITEERWTYQIEPIGL